MPDLRILEPASSRGGRRFEASHERSLYPEAMEAVMSLPGASRGALVVPELHAPLGVPDFVAFMGADDAIERRIASGIAPILSPTDLALVAALHEARPLTAETVARQMRMALPNVEMRLRRLEREGAVARRQSVWLRNPALTPAGRVFAVETKLKDWRKAIHQARGYRTWANNYVLVVGGIGEKATRDAREAVRADGAGLYVGRRWLVRPSARAVSRQSRLEAFEYLASALLPGPALGSRKVL